MAKLSRFQSTVVDEAGDIIPGASVEVRSEQDTSLSTIYSDRTGLTPIANPMTADAEGFFAFYATAGAYKIVATSGAFTRTWRHISLGTIAEHDEDEYATPDDLVPLQEAIDVLNGLLPLTENSFDDDSITPIRNALRIRPPDIFDFKPQDDVVVVGYDWRDAMIAAEAAAFTGLIRSLFFPYIGDYYLVSGIRIPFRSGLVLRGEHNLHTQLRFTDPNGGLYWTASSGNGGGGVFDLGLLYDLGGGNGNVLMQVGDGVTTINTPGGFNINNLYLSALGGSTMNYCLLVDGTGRPGDIGGVRSSMFNNIITFNAVAGNAIELRYVRAMSLVNVWCFEAGGTNNDMLITGLAGVGDAYKTSSGVTISGWHGGDLIVDYGSDITGSGIAALNSVSYTANAANVDLYGKTPSFGNAGGGTNKFNGATS